MNSFGTLLCGVDGHCYWSNDDGATWKFATFADAMSAVNGQTAIVEFYRDITVTANRAISSGNVVIRSVPGEKNLVDPGKICTLTRGSSFKDKPMFSVSGGATVVFDDVVLNGAKISLYDVDGALIKITGSETTVTINDGVTLKDSYTKKSAGTGFGGAVYIAAGSTFNMNGGLIQNCQAKNGGAMTLDTFYGALSAIPNKYNNGKLIVVDDITLDTYKTKTMVAMFSALGAEKKPLVVLPEVNSFVVKSCANIPGAKTCLYNTINVYDILNADTFITTVAAVKMLEEVYA